MELASNIQEWKQLVQRDLSKWNNESHPDDRLSWNDYIGELCGTVSYGYKVVRDDNAINGYRIERIQSQHKTL